MPRKKKHPQDMTTDEAVDHLFPGELADALRDEVADEPDEEEEEDEGDGTEDNDEGDDKNDDGYSERAQQDDGYIF